ncbi:hypothetical protein QTN25_007491 [Entamoeba marina]
MKLEKLFLTKVVAYLDSVETAINFFIINKKCSLISSLLRINPFYGSETVERELELFPNIETLRCNTKTLTNIDKLPESIKYIEVLNTYSKESNYEKDIPKEVLQYVTSFTTYLRKLSILKQMHNLEYLKVICVENRVINSQIFKEIIHNENLKTVVIDTRECDPKFIIDPLMKFDTTRIHFIIICSELNEILTKKNVTFVCAHGNSEVTRLLNNEYIPYKRTSRSERNKFFQTPFFSFIERHKHLYTHFNPEEEQYYRDFQCFNKNNEYFRYDIDSLENIENFQTLSNKVLPVDVGIDVGKKKGSKAVLVKQIDLKYLNIFQFLKSLALVGTGNGKKLINISLPSMIQRLAICKNSFNITTPNLVQQLYYYDSNNLQTNITSATKLSINKLSLLEPLNLTKMENLKELDIASNCGTILFPLHKLNVILLSGCTATSVKNLSTKELLIQNVLNFNMLDQFHFESLDCRHLGEYKLPDLRNFNSLTSLYVDQNPFINPLPTSLKCFTYQVSRNQDLNQFSELVHDLTNLESLFLSSYFAPAITHLNNLTSLTLCIPGYDKTPENLSKVNLSNLSKLVEIEYQYTNGFPRFPTSVTKLDLSFYHNKCYDKKPDLNSYANLQNLSIVYLNQPITVPSTLTYLSYGSSSPDHLDLTYTPIKKLSYCVDYFANKQQLLLPTTLETFLFSVNEIDNVELVDLTTTPHLKSLKFHFSRQANKNQLCLGPWFLPSSLKEIENTSYGNFKITYDNVENTQLNSTTKRKLLMGKL